MDTEPETVHPASATVVAAVEVMTEHEEERERALEVVAEEIRRRLETPREEYLDHEEVFSWPSRGS